MTLLSLNVQQGLDKKKTKQASLAHSSASPIYTKTDVKNFLVGGNNRQGSHVSGKSRCVAMDEGTYVCMF
jgi:hypothetical protein